MNLTNDQSSFSKEHSYVILEQHPTDSGEQRKIGEDSHPDEEEEDDDDEENSVEVQLHESNVTMGDKPRVGLLSKSRFSDLTLKLLSALLYGTCSFLITVINKIVLTSYKFPSSNILGIGQMVAIIIILRLANQFNAVTIRRVSIWNKKIWILAFIYVCNLVTGLGGTKLLPLPMFIALRRFSIAMTAVAMIGGSFIAAASDLTFNAIGYLLVMAGNLFTAANVVYIKKTIDSREINKHEILFYSALLTIVPLIIVSYFTNNVETLYNFGHWTEFGFILSFLTSCVMGYLLMFSTILCTHYNSALTTTIVGTLKNILTTYVGMYIGGDYQFNLLNFIGLNISLIGSLVYSYLTFVRSNGSKGQAIKI